MTASSCDYERQIGFSGFDSLGQNPDFRFDYWYGVRDALNEIGCSVHTARVPPFAGIQQRAERLKEYIERSLPHGAEVNLIGNDSFLETSSEYAIKANGVANSLIRRRFLLLKVTPWEVLTVAT